MCLGRSSLRPCRPARADRGVDGHWTGQWALLSPGSPVPRHALHPVGPESLPLYRRDPAVQQRLQKRQLCSDRCWYRPITWGGGSTRARRRPRRHASKCRRAWCVPFPGALPTWSMCQQHTVMAGGIRGTVLTKEGHTPGRLRQAVVRSNVGAVLAVHSLTPPTGSPARTPPHGRKRFAHDVTLALSLEAGSFGLAFYNWPLIINSSL